MFAIGQAAQDKRSKLVKQAKVRASEYLYDSDNVIVYEITNEDGYVRFLHEGYGKESEHLRDKSEEDVSQVRSYILTCHREVKSVREIADLVNRSKTSWHRSIARENNKEDVAPVEGVPPGDVGQVGHLGQFGQSEPVQVHGRSGILDDLVFEMDENQCLI